MQGKVEIAGINTSKLKVLKNEETIALLRKYKEGDPAARQTLIEGNLRLVLSVIQRFNGRSESVDDLFQIIHKKLPQYGFILRYPADKKPITKIGYEPWHFRYIDSPEIAQQIADGGLCFEEYWENRRSEA